jgi:branched-chain amino acid aminotransferase
VELPFESLNEPLCVSNGQFLPLTQLSLSIADQGFIHGVTISEQVRTLAGQPFKLHEHYQRWVAGWRLIGLQPPVEFEELEQEICQLLVHNQRLISKPHALAIDQGICFLGTPGSTNLGWAALEASPPGYAIYTYPLPLAQHQKHYQDGVRLVSVAVRDVPGSCWPPSVKIRSRLHYYLAQIQAKQPSTEAFPILLDQQGFVSDSAISSIVGWHKRDGIIVRPHELRYDSISVRHLIELGLAEGLSVSERCCTIEQLKELDELFLLSTPWCMYPVRQIDNNMCLGSKAGFPVFKQLFSAWQRGAGCPIYPLG